MNITDLLKNNGALEKIAAQYGIDTSQVEDIVKNAVPEITNGINSNTSSADGLKDFWKALNDHKDAPVEDYLQDPNLVDTDDGEKILGHILGDQKENLAENLAQKQGIAASNIGGILKYLAPVIMGMMAKEALGKKQVQAQTSGGSILESMLGGNSAVTQMAKSFLDKNKDGNVLDDIIGGLFGR